MRCVEKFGDLDDGRGEDEHSLARRKSFCVGEVCKPGSLGEWEALVVESLLLISIARARIPLWYKIYFWDFLSRRRVWDNVRWEGNVRMRYADKANCSIFMFSGSTRVSDATGIM